VYFCFWCPSVQIVRCTHHTVRCIHQTVWCIHIGPSDACLLHLRCFCPDCPVFTPDHPVHTHWTVRCVSSAPEVLLSRLSGVHTRPSGAYTPDRPVLIDRKQVLCLFGFSCTFCGNSFCIFVQIKFARIGTQCLVDCIYSFLSGVAGKPQFISL